MVINLALWNRAMCIRVTEMHLELEHRSCPGVTSSLQVHWGQKVAMQLYTLVPTLPVVMEAPPGHFTLFSFSIWACPPSVKLFFPPTYFQKISICPYLVIPIFLIKRVPSVLLQIKFLNEHSPFLFFSKLSHQFPSSRLFSVLLCKNKKTNYISCKHREKIFNQ
jgi:hypothetical protein